MPDTLRGRTELGSGPVLLVVALVAAAVAGTVFVVSRMHGESEPVPLRAESPGSAAPVLSPGPASASALPAATGDVTVDVAGKVRRPG